MRRVHAIESCVLAWGLATVAVPAQGGHSQTGVEERLETAIVEHLRAIGRVELRPDAALRAVAREHSEVLAAGGGIDTYEFLRMSESAHDILDPFPYAFCGSTPDGGLDELEHRLLRGLDGIAPGERRLYTHVAVGVVERARRRALWSRESVYHVTALLTQRAVSFAALPEVARPGERVVFEGEIHAPFRDPEILVTRPDGTTGELENLSLEPQHFKTYVKFDRGAGEYQLEVMGKYDLGPRVLGLCSLFPRQAGEPAPYERLLRAARDGTLGSVRVASAAVSQPLTEGEAESLLVSLVNRDRHHFGLPPLEPHVELCRLARAHCADMRDHDYFAHVSPRAGNLAERARTAGIRFSRLAENIAVNRTIEEAEAALLRSPGHRMNLLSADFTRLGVGVAFDRDGQGERRVYVTENFLVP
jgi:uncharacterized protein YkwD